jgi:dTDP-4-amino-4,6-dideoxygalactose transaminase
LTEGDEVIMPSYTYPSTANAVVLVGGKVVFSEVLEENLTIDPSKIEEKITLRTRAIIVVHYGGASCQMEEIMDIAQKYNLIVIEDAAQSFLTKYQDKYTGTIGHIGCFSFCGTEDFVAGEGGAISINDSRFSEEIEVFRQKGTNRSAFVDGRSEYYEWVHEGSNFSPSELTMAVLYSQFELKERIISKRRNIYQHYLEYMDMLTDRYKLSHRISYSRTPSQQVNGHLFYILFNQVNEANAFRIYLAKNKIETRTHLVALHESQKGKEYIKSSNPFKVEAMIGQRLVRLPIYPDLQPREQESIQNIIRLFFKEYMGIDT